MGDWRMGRSMFSRDNSELDIVRTLEKIGSEEFAPRDNGRRASPRLHALQPKNVNPYLEVGMANSAPLAMLFGQRCMIDFCLV
jgi:hypothetical protein